VTTVSLKTQWPRLGSIWKVKCARFAPCKMPSPRVLSPASVWDTLALSSAFREAGIKSEHVNRVHR
jgi:hypothetical protein